jgi:hypothetical protein
MIVNSFALSKYSNDYRQAHGSKHVEYRQYHRD